MDCYCIQRSVTHSRTPYIHGQSKTLDINYSRDIKTKTYSLIRVALEYERKIEREEKTLLNREKMNKNDIHTHSHSSVC